MSTETRPHPPSVEAVAAASRTRLGEGARPEAIVDVARAVVAEERDRNLADDEPRTVDALADEVASQARRA